MGMFALHMLTEILMDSRLGGFANAAEKPTELNWKYWTVQFGFKSRNWSDFGVLQTAINCE